MLDKELLDWKQKDEKKSNDTITIEKEDNCKDKQAMSPKWK